MGNYACSLPPKGFPILYTHGTSDDNEPFELVFADFKHYAQDVLGCTGDVYANKQGKATCYQYSSCSSGSHVGYCTVDGMGHVWPTNYGYNALSTAMSWFKGGW